MLKLVGIAAVMGSVAPAALASSIMANELQGKRILIAYFSMPETDNQNNMTREEDNSVVVVNGKVLGNTQYVAQLIQGMTGGTIFRIEPEHPYPKDHRTLVALAKDEQNRNARPAISGTVDMTHYDTIFLGYPNWWADMPMVLYTFLEQYNFSGKTIIPFCTHGGSGFSNTIQSIASKQPGATVIKKGFALSRSSMEQAPSGVAGWLKKLNLKK
ncbi:flavodoxin [Desulfovibrio desulfuricans]|nr:flavodoxin [Desulfovibrio desulfuricans]